MGCYKQLMAWEWAQAGGGQGVADDLCSRGCTCWLALALGHSTPEVEGGAAAAVLSYWTTAVVAQSRTDMCGSGALTDQAGYCDGVLGLLLPYIVACIQATYLL